LQPQVNIDFGLSLELRSDPKFYQDAGDRGQKRRSYDTNILQEAAKSHLQVDLSFLDVFNLIILLMCVDKIRS